MNDPLGYNLVFVNSWDFQYCLQNSEQKSWKTPKNWHHNQGPQEQRKIVYGGALLVVFWFTTFLVKILQKTLKSLTILFAGQKNWQLCLLVFDSNQLS